MWRLQGQKAALHVQEGGLPAMLGREEGLDYGRAEVGSGQGPEGKGLAGSALECDSWALREFSGQF